MIWTKRTWCDYEVSWCDLKFCWCEPNTYGVILNNCFLFTPRGMIFTHVFSWCSCLRYVRRGWTIKEEAHKHCESVSVRRTGDNVRSGVFRGRQTWMNHQGSWSWGHGRGCVEKAEVLRRALQRAMTSWNGYPLVDVSMGARHADRRLGGLWNRHVLKRKNAACGHGGFIQN